MGLCYDLLFGSNHVSGGNLPPMEEGEGARNISNNLGLIPKTSNSEQQNGFSVDKQSLLFALLQTQTKMLTSRNCK